MKDYIINKIIFMNTSPSICLKNIEKRGWKEECITLEYLQKCHESHVPFIKQFQYVLTVDNMVLNEHGCNLGYTKMDIV